MPPSRTTTGYVPFARYLEANRAGAARTADALAGGVEYLGGQADDKLKTALGDFDQNRADGEVRYAPTGLTGEQATARAGATYAGPNGLEDVESFTPGLKSAQQAAEQAALSQSVGGRQALLSKQYGGQGGYNPGQSRFDAALTGASAQGRFDANAGRYSALLDKYGTESTAARGRAEQSRNTSRLAAQEYGRTAPMLQQQEQRERQAAEQQAMEAQRREDTKVRAEQVQARKAPRRSGSKYDSLWTP